MELFHTSPSEIASITTGGRYGEFLCFASKPYSMSAGSVVTYKVEVDEADIIEAGSLYYHEDAGELADLTERVMEMVGCDEVTAEELISQRADVFSLDNIDADDAGEVSWDIQAISAQAAKLLGFRGVRMQDEQGACYMIDMIGRENDLERA